MRLPACLIAACLIVTGSAPAAQIRFRTLCFKHQQDIRKVCVPSAAKEGMLEVPLLTSTYSEQLTMPVEDGTAVFSVENPDSDKPENAYLPVARAKVPAANVVLFLFLPPAKDDKLPYRVIALADDVASFPWGHARLLNIAAVPARFHLGEFSGQAAKTLKPGELVTVGRIRKCNDFNMYNVVIEFQGEKGFLPVSNTRWKCVDGKRDLAIAYIDPASRRPVVNLYEDVQPANLP